MRSGYKIISFREPAVGNAYITDMLDDETRVICYQLINLQHADGVVGYVDLVQTGYGHWETHTFLDEEERGKGLGVELFNRAFSLSLQKDRQVMSSPYTSNDARRLWESKSLNRVYEIEKVQALEPHRQIEVFEDYDERIKAKRQSFQYKLIGRQA